MSNTTKLARVYHGIDFAKTHDRARDFGTGPLPAISPDEYRLVARVDVLQGDDIDGTGDAFRLTNSIDSAWWENAEVIPAFPGDGCRSTSVGDIIVVESGAWMVLRFGYRRIGSATWGCEKAEGGAR